MKVLVVGGGGREHAMAWAASRSPLVARVVMAPGNGAWPSSDRWALAADDVVGLVERCRTEGVDLVLIGPEVALAAGLADALAVAGIKAFGPSRAASELEWSKVACREFAARHGLPSPRYAAFTSVADATDFARSCGFPVVVKQSGLAAGKGVIVPDDVEGAVAAIAALGAGGGGELVLEERLEGEEVSLLAFTDGTTVVAMPPAQDHKRAGEGDVGPNTGGMGAVAPAPCCPPPLVDELVATVLQPAVAALAAEGRPYVGVLYAGLMLTADGPRLLEFNCRFGDPEAQVLLPLLEADLVEVALACVEGRLAEAKVTWSEAAACTVVVAAEGYPGKPATGGRIELPASGLVFQAGTEHAADGDGIVVSGGRVVNCTGVGDDLAAARAAAVALAGDVRFDGAWYRRDIGWRALARLGSIGGYAASGVDIDAGEHTVDLLSTAVKRTHDDRVLAGVGAFGGAFDASALRNYDAPVLVASTDGVGTKLSLAAGAGPGRLAGCGADIVNHCVNDVLVQGAEPLFFLDYVASGRLVPAQVAELVSGMGAACEANGCVLLGGETAEMPGVYTEGELDLAGTLVGVAERAALLPRADVGPGDVLVGFGSSGPHTNGYSLLRRVFAALPLDAQPAPLPRPIGEELLEPHRSYLSVLRPVLAAGVVKALAHITGGGLPGNVPRALPAVCGAVVRLGSWPVPPLFRLVTELTGLPADELHRTLNMGIGMVVICAPGDVAEVQRLAGEETWVIGEVVAGDHRVVFV